MQQHERRLAELEQLLGKKEVEIALLKNFFPEGHRDGVGQPVLADCPGNG